MSHPCPLYETDGLISSEFVTYDLSTGVYVRQVSLPGSVAVSR